MCQQCKMRNTLHIEDRHFYFIYFFEKKIYSTILVNAFYPPLAVAKRREIGFGSVAAVVPPLTVKRVTRYSKTITSPHSRTALAISLQDDLIPQSTARSPGQGNTPYRWGQEPRGQWESLSVTSWLFLASQWQSIRPSGPPPLCTLLKPEYIHGGGGGEQGRHRAGARRESL